MTKKKQTPKPSWVSQTSGYQKLMLAVLSSVLGFILLLFTDLNILTRLTIAWDVFALSMIGMSWTLFFNTTAEEQCDVVEKQDDGLKIIFTIVLISVFVSLLGALLLITQSGLHGVHEVVGKIATLSAVALSWFLLHTIFTIRYAHLYRDYNKLNTGVDVGGIEFPNCKLPDYLDFAYFSFVIGMTFQVSDTNVSSRVIRRFVLLHSLISFVYNTIIVALTINAIANLSK